MYLSPGARLGQYEILALLGTGGMGEVYRAVDDVLGREVAIKVLPAAFANHPDHLARFSREARVLASLSHPNIAVVHSLEHVGNAYYLEMELVRGETLAHRLTRGRMAVSEALPIFKQMAEAIEAAHVEGIVHRDLKPANIMVTPDGVVKILDFGLAKIMSGDDSSVPRGSVVTLTTSTEVGFILGTAAYMSPEQARGEAVDRRTDIWAFGCVLYEALTGERAFRGRTAPDTIAAVLTDEPDWAKLASVAPQRLQPLIRRCLQKDARRRLHDIADARIELDELLHDSATESSRGRSVADGPRAVLRSRALVQVAAVSLAVVALGGAVAWWLAGASPAPQDVARVMITVPANQRLERGRFNPVAVSPDGRALVYTAAERGGRSRLYLRRVDELDARPLAETEGASTPFFSADGRWLAFYADGALKRVSLVGGVPLTIADTPPVWSATWGGDHIIFATTLAASGLWIVSSNGGEPAPLTEPAGDDGQHGYPQMLPGGTHVLFSVLGADGWRPAVLSLVTREWRVITQARVVGEGAQYLPTGHLAYVQSGGLVATPFVPPDGELNGPSIPLLERVQTSRFGGAYFAVAADAGTLVYLSANSATPARTLLRVDREGRAVPVVDTRMGYEHPALSPDGRRVAVTIASEMGSDIWIIDLERGTRSRFTAGGTSAFPVWSADGARLAYQSTAPGPWNLYWKPLDQSAGEQPLLQAASALQGSAWPDTAAGLLPGTPPTLSGANPQFPMSWADGHSALAVHERKPDGERDIWIIRPDGEAAPFLLNSFDERSPRFSPDGDWLAYVSNESGRDEVYVQPFPGPGPKWLISTNGGADPVWARDGRELFYRQDDQLMVVSVVSGPSFSTGRPRRLFDAHIDADDNGLNYDVSPDGRWFVMLRGDRTLRPDDVHVVLNWFTAVKALTSAGE